MPLYGDLHVHTGFSFDARSYDTVLHPRDAYDFARGGEVGLPPLDSDGTGTRTARLDRPLDFAAVTDHGEYLGEIALCTTPGSPGYDSETCTDYRDPAINGAVRLAIKLSVPGTPRFADICGPRDADCHEAARARWREMQLAAEEAYDRTSACSFTSFVAYEYTNTGGVSNLHRNVVFGSSIVPEAPITTFEAPAPVDLWRQLDAECKQAASGCDVLVLPHNSNLSNGNLFYLGDLEGLADADRRERLELRQAMEPVVEMFQHKGDSECRNDLPGVPHDPECDFEKLRPPDAEVCGELPGSGGMRLQGCVHRLDFARNVLAEGLAEAERHGFNPYRLGFIGSTDTHNGIPGHVGAEAFPGHVGIVDDTDVERLGAGNVTHDGVINNPGGLAAVWATENSRPAIFRALRERETFATSGPRIALRFFGGGDFARSTCARDPRDRIARAYETGVPMGGVFTPEPGSAPRFLIDVRADRTPLAALQIVKGWVDEDGELREEVHDVDVFTGLYNVDTDTCRGEGDGWDEHCAIWIDHGYRPGQRAFYYARALEQPSCRWSTHTCNQLAPADRPAGCDEDTPSVVRHRAWSSPIWIEPE